MMKQRHDMGATLRINALLLNVGDVMGATFTIAPLSSFIILGATNRNHSMLKCRSIRSVYAKCGTYFGGKRRNPRICEL